MTIPELRVMFMQAAILSTAAMLQSLRWGKAEWTAYFMKFAGMSGALGCSLAVIEKKLLSIDSNDARLALATDIFPDAATNLQPTNKNEVPD
jgi:hypothetical protein